MPKFRKKPVEVEAWRVRDLLNKDICEFPPAIADSPTVTVYPNTIRIGTLEGVMTADRDDWIIRGVKGELYPCKPDVFIATYDPA